MGFSENYLERRKKRLGSGETSSTDGDGTARAADSFTARYLERRAAEAPPAAVQTALSTGPRTLSEAIAEQWRARAAEEKAAADVQSRSPVWAREMVDRYQPKSGSSPLSPVAQYEAENQVAAKNRADGQTEKKPSAGDWAGLAGNTLMAGVGQVSKASSSLFSAAEQMVSRPLGWLLGNPDLYKDAPLYQLDKAVDRDVAAIQENLAGSAEKAGKAGELIAKFGPATVAALPQAALAYLTAGQSLAAQGTTAGLQAASTAAQLTGGAATANVVLQAVQGMAKNPSFQYSFLNTVGGEYQQALEDGADAPTAYAYAALSSLANSMVEVGGGIDTLPEAVRGKSKGQLLEWVKSMFDEGKEEVVQGAISQMMQNGVYQKGNPFFSMTDENAVVNPGRMAEEFAGGAVVGGVLGGGQIAVNAAIDSAARKAAQRAVQAQEARGDTGIPAEAQTAPEAQESGGAEPFLPVEGQKNTAQGADQKGKTIVEHLRGNAKALGEMEPVARLIGTELPKQGRATDRAMAFLQKIGNKVNRPGFGDVLFSRAKVKTALVGHGTSEAKIETIAAVPEVIKNGQLLNQIENYNGRGYDTFVFGAPVTYKDRTVLVGAVVAKDKITGRYYVHEVVDSDGNILLDSKEPEGNSDRPPNMDGPVIPSGSIAEDAPAAIKTGVTAESGITGTAGAPEDTAHAASNHIVQQQDANVNGVNSVENAGKSAEQMTGRLVRMGEQAETAARIGELLGQVKDGRTLTEAELNEVRNNPSGAKLIDAVQGIADRRAAEDIKGGQKNEAETGSYLPDGQEKRGIGADSGGPAGAVSESAGGWAAEGQRGGAAADDGKIPVSVREETIPDRASGTQSLRAIARQNAVTESGAEMVSTREYMGLDIGSDRPSLFDAPEEVIRSDKVLSEIYDEIWEMGYKPHFFTGSPELEGDAFSFNGAVNGEDVYIRIDHGRYDADAIWEHEKFHILSAEDPGLRSNVRDALLQQYGQTELMKIMETYLEKYRGAYGMETVQGLWDLSEADMDLILEELLADAYAGKDAFRAGTGKYRDTVREISSRREEQGYRAGRAPDSARFDIGYDRNNRPFVTVEEDILEGVPQKDWVRTVKDNLRKKFPGGVAVGNRQIQINATTRNELTGSRNTRKYRAAQPQIYGDKMRVTNNLDEVLQASRDYVNEAPLHPRTDNFTDFGRGKVQIRVGGRDYTADVVVGYTTGGKMIMYDIVNMQETAISDKKTPDAEFADQPHKAGRSVDSSTPTQSAAPASGESTLSQTGQHVKPRRTFSEEVMAQLTGEDSGNGETGSVVGPSAPRYSAEDGTQGLSLPALEERTEEDGQKRTAPAERRKAASRKLADDLAGIFPETSRKYLRDLADEIRSGTRGTGADTKEIEKLFKKAYKKARAYEDSPEGAELRDIARELRGRRVYADENVRELFGDDWKDMWWFFARRGLHITDDSSDMGLDALNKELASKFGDKFKRDETDQGNIISRLEYVLRQGDAKKITLDEQARQYGGEEAVQKFREAYRQRFMDAAERYRDTMSGIAEDQRKAREDARRRRRQELEDYLEEARRTLRDRAAQGKDTGKTDPRTHVPEGMTIDEYVQSLEQRAAQAREERLRDLQREDFRGSEAMEKLGVKISGAVTEDYQNAPELRRRQEAAEKARRAVRRAEKRMNATEAEKEFASGITSGIYTESDIPRTMNADRVMELADYYMGERAFGFDLLRQRKADISRAQQEKAKEIFGPALEANEGKKWLTGKTAAVMRSDAFVLNNRTAERNMRSIFGDEAGDRINRWLFAPVAENEGERYRFVNRMLDQVREIEGADGKKRKLTKAESALVQKTIEGRAAAEAVASMEMGESIRNAAQNLNKGGDMKDVAREFRLNEEDRRLARQYAMWLETQEEIKSADGVKIDNAVKLYSDLYGQFYEAINDFLAVHGYEPIGFIKGYAPHMQSKETVGALNRAFQSLGLGADAGGLPTAIAGLTKDFKPGKRWNPFFQTRRGEATDYDITEGFERYVDHLSDVLYHTDDITRIREANKFLRKMYDQEEINERISQARELRYRTTKEKRDFLVDQGELDPRRTLTADEIEKRMDEYSDRLYENVRNTSRYGQLAVWLDDYANMLAGKQVFADRDMERSFGRTSLNVGNKLTRAFTRAQVSGNISSVLNQTSQLPLIQAEVGSKYLWHAMRDMGAGNLRKGDWALKSDFLTEKNGIDYITTSPSDMIVGAMFKPMGFVDGFLSTLAVRGRYLKEIDAGRSEAEAMRIADRYGREVMGSRAKGSAPLAFQSKNIFNRMLHAFQLEALNTWEHISQDLPRDYRAIAKAKGKNAAARAFAGTAVKILTGNFLLNRASEMLYGGTPAQGDVFGIIGNFVASGAGTTLNAVTISAMKKIINAGWEKVVGEKLFDDDDEEDEEERPFDLAEAAKSAGSDMLNDTPLAKNAGALFGIGDLSLPMPDLVKGVQRTADAAKEDGLFSHEVMRQLMGLAGDVVPGGRQAEKTFQGLDTALRGGRYSGYGEKEKLMYPVDEDPFTALRAALFGNSALEETGEYYASGNKALSVEQTKVYKDAVAAGGGRKEIYNAILDWRNVNGDAELTSEEKARMGEEIVGETDLSDRDKLKFYKGLTGADSRADKLEKLLNAGMDWDGAIGAYAMYDEIKRREGMTAGERATAFAKWADETYPAKQAGAVREQFVYYSMVPAQAGRYDKLTGAGLGTDTAYRLSEILGALEPEPGKNQVSNMQKYQAIVSAELSESDQLKAMEAVMSEGEYAKVRAGYEQGVTPELYVRAREAAAGYDANGNGAISQDEAKRAIKAMDGLTSEQRAALWQIQNKSWKPDNNPFNKKVGREVYQELNQEEEDEESSYRLPGLSLPSLR